MQGHAVGEEGLAARRRPRSSQVSCPQRQPHHALRVFEHRVYYLIVFTRECNRVETGLQDTDNQERSMRPIMVWFLLLLSASSILAQDWARARVEKSPRHREWVTVKRVAQSLVFQRLCGLCMCNGAHNPLSCPACAACFYLADSPSSLAGSGLTGRWLRNPNSSAWHACCASADRNITFFLRPGFSCPITGTPSYSPVSRSPSRV